MTTVTSGTILVKQQTHTCTHKSRTFGLGREDQTKLNQNRFLISPNQPAPTPNKNKTNTNRYSTNETTICTIHTTHLITRLYYTFSKLRHTRTQSTHHLQGLPFVTRPSSATHHDQGGPFVTHSSSAITRYLSSLIIQQHPSSMLSLNNINRHRRHHPSPTTSPIILSPTMSNLMIQNEPYHSKCTVSPISTITIHHWRHVKMSFNELLEFAAVLQKTYKNIYQQQATILPIINRATHNQLRNP